MVQVIYGFEISAGAHVVSAVPRASLNESASKLTQLFISSNFQKNQIVCKLKMAVNQALES